MRMRIGKARPAFPRVGTKKYLVIGLYKETDERWAETVETDDPEQLETLAAVVAPCEVTIAAIIDKETCEVVA